MQLLPIEKLKIGDIFHFPNKKTPYVYQGYNSHTRRYEYNKFYDTSAFYDTRKGKLVDVSVTF